MTAKRRDIPQQLAAFGERQYHETDALAVEVLRVKMAALRKYLREIGPTSYLVAVISSDRVRIYYFAESGVMLGADNIDHVTYERVRAIGRLMVKFERPREPTPEELRLNATEELRNLLSRSIRRVARMLGVNEPRFPNMYVLRESLNERTQSFGIRVGDDGALYFSEATVNAPWVEGVALRMAFLLCCGAASMRTEFSVLVGNAVAYSSLRPPEQTKWLEIWTVNTKGGPWVPFLNHFVMHSETYIPRGYSILRGLIARVAGTESIEQWTQVLQLIHDGIELPVNTEQYHVIRGLCDTLTDPRQLIQKKHTHLAVHLAPRAICNANAIGTPLSIRTLTTQPATQADLWLDVEYIAGSQTNHLVVEPGSVQPLNEIRYVLNIDDIVPKSGGLMSQGVSILRHAADILGLKSEWVPTYSAQLNLRTTSDLPVDQLAVLQRLLEGGTAVLNNSLTGSLNRIEALATAGHVVLLPDFGHIGVKASLLIIGDECVLNDVCKYALETTAFVTTHDIYMVVAATSIWQEYLIDIARDRGLQVYPIVRATSRRGLVRTEILLPESLEGLLWT